MNRTTRLDQRITRHDCGTWLFDNQPCGTCSPTAKNDDQCQPWDVTND